MDTLLVTGGTGHLGRDLVNVLKDRYALAKCQAAAFSTTHPERSAAWRQFDGLPSV
jgi:dTDP-4-dehydrorhamnose reductase